MSFKAHYNSEKARRDPADFCWVLSGLGLKLRVKAKARMPLSCNCSRWKHISFSLARSLHLWQNCDTNNLHTYHKASRCSRLLLLMGRELIPVTIWPGWTWARCQSHHPLKCASPFDEAASLEDPPHVFCVSLSKPCASPPMARTFWRASKNALLKVGCMNHSNERSG